MNEVESCEGLLKTRVVIFLPTPRLMQEYEFITGIVKLNRKVSIKDILHGKSCDRKCSLDKSLQLCHGTQNSYRK
jgi:hypothetical protein